jgi:hypothetical protein
MSDLYFIKEKQALKIKKVEGKFSESEIEDFIHSNSEVLIGRKLLFIGKQVITETGKRIDLLAIDSIGRLIVIELKKGIAPREMMAQILDYSSWLIKLSERQLEEIARNHFKKFNVHFNSLLEGFEKTFKSGLPSRFGHTIVNVLFAQDFPQDLINSTQYLVNNGTPIYLIKFDYYDHPDKGLFLLVDNITGEENELVEIEETQLTTKSYKPPLVTPKNKEYRKIINELADFLENKYGDWMESLDYEIKYKNQTYQRQDGTITSVRTVWRMHKKYFNLEFGIYSKDNYTVPDAKSDGFLARILFDEEAVRDKIEILSSNLQQLGYEKKEQSKGYRRYAKLFIDSAGSNLFELESEKIKEVADSEMEKIKPVLEDLFKHN